MSTHTVYLIENTVNDKIYVGVTSKSLEQRLKRHISDAHQGQERHLQRSIRKHGEDAFEIHPLQDAEDREEAFELEEHWIELLDTYERDHGYNMSPGGDAPPKYVTREMKRKISESMKGKTHSEKTKLKLSEIQKNRTYCKETKRKMSKANSGERCSNSKLTERQVSEIKWLYENTNRSQYELANSYSVSQSVISRIVNEQSWKYTSMTKPANL